jgi:AcrR family transcriptional regulator
MRLIATEADCSLGLAYNFVDSKEELFVAVLARIAERLSERTSLGDGGAHALTSLWEVMEENPVFWRIMTWLVLEGVDGVGSPSRRPVITDVAKLAAERGADDPSVVGGVVAFFGLSFQVFGPLVNRSMGHSVDDERFRNAVVDMFSTWFDQQFDDSVGDQGAAKKPSN